MAFDCICVNFQNSEHNLNIIKQRMPHAKIITFVHSYIEILRSLVSDARTSHVWMISSLIDYSKFNFDYIPEQHQDQQIHVWHNEEQKEGDTLLIPCAEFLKQIQELKFLRDFKDKCEKEKRCVSKMIDSFMTYDVKSQISTDKILSLI